MTRSGRKRGSFWALSLIAMVLGAPAANAQKAPAPPAPADPAKRDREARDHYEMGINHYNMGEFDFAIAEFRQAYLLSASPSLLFNIAQAFRLKKDYEQAHAFYRTYLRHQPDAPNRDDVEGLIGDMEKQMAKQRVKRERPPDPLLESASNGNNEDRVPAAPTGETGEPAPDQAARLQPPAILSSKEEARPTDLHPGRTKRILGLSVGGAAVAMLGVAIYFGLAAQDAEDQVNHVRNTRGPWTPQINRVYEDGQSDATTATVLFATGGTALAAGALLYYLGWRDEAATRVSITPRLGGATAALSVRF
jgi:tetratricopeptide (TPR) repeat protein